MKNLFLTIAIVLYSVSITAQMNFRAYKFTYKEAIETVPENRITSYSTKVISNENFKYRAFLRESRKSNEKFQIGLQNLSKKELTKLLRNCARKSKNPEEFKDYLLDSNPEFSNYFSDSHTPVLYSKFNKGTLNQYVTDLMDDW
ncbi:hypothetical protein [Gillisia hiemivivida]|jgi:hypothetical protein|uniref:Uncharacterized protein n=1 Tax=Gillisia hiemivivida TaxID=291190 RepID=A0A5C6ZY28_9FLAO|nr:hypothetical protein [Gillisia hiemivivida]TXD95006.1 hypothetical protein ES724_02285 [Gillisia hiemivivida]